MTGSVAFSTITPPAGRRPKTSRPVFIHALKPAATKAIAFRGFHPDSEAGNYRAAEVRLAGASGRRFLGMPLGWQSRHFTKWMLCGLWVDLKVVSIVSTSRPQFDSRGWQVAQE